MRHDATAGNAARVEVESKRSDAGGVLRGGGGSGCSGTGGFTVSPSGQPTPPYLPALYPEYGGTKHLDHLMSRRCTSVAVRSFFFRHDEGQEGKKSITEASRQAPRCE